jgi:glutamine synthetase
MGFQIYTSHHEVAAGQHEINFHYADALTTADRVVTLRYVAKIIALNHDLHATFMPKPLFGTNGTGMHTHMSLFSNGENAFFDEAGLEQLSDSALHYIGGLLTYSKEMNAILNSWVNSYKRLVPGFEAPTYIAWATSNRSALIRIPAKRGSGSRCELRNPDPAGNPYLQFAVMLAAGLKGIEKKIEPPDPVEKDIYALSPRERELMGIETLPSNLGHAISFMEKSELILETLGPHIFENFLYLKTEEWNEYRTQVTGWEIEKFLPFL